MSTFKAFLVFSNFKLTSNECDLKDSVQHTLDTLLSFSILCHATFIHFFNVFFNVSKLSNNK